MAKISNLVQQVTDGTGTGNLTLVHVPGKVDFSTAFSAGAFFYFISARSSDEWEIGNGHMSGSALVRDSVLFSSNANSLVNFTAGTKDVINDLPASYQDQLEQISITSGKTLTVPDNATVSGVNTGDQTITLQSEASGSGTSTISVTLSNAAVIAKQLTSFNAGAGTVSATDSILSAFQKVVGNINALISGVSSVFGRTGAVTAQSGDYNTSQVTESGNLYFTNGRAQAAITGGASSIVTSNLTADRAAVSDGSGKVAVSATTATEIGYVSGVTSSIQTQLNSKQASGSYITALTGDGTAAGPGSSALTLSTVNSNTGSFGSSTSIPSITVNGKGLITAASGNAVVAPAGTLSGNTLASGVTASSLTSVGTLTGGATGAGFTVALGASTITGDLPFSNIAQIGANTVVANPSGSTADLNTVALSSSQLFGRGSTGNLTAINLGANLSMSGATLNASGGGGGGDVSGPGSSTDMAIVRWDGTNGELVQDSGIIVDDDNNLTLPEDGAVVLADSITNVGFTNSDGQLLILSDNPAEDFSVVMGSINRDGTNNATLGVIGQFDDMSNDGNLLSIGYSDAGSYQILCLPINGGTALPLAVGDTTTQMQFNGSNGLTVQTNIMACVLDSVYYSEPTTILGSQTNGETLKLRGWNTNTSAYVDAFTITAGNPPTFDLNSTTTKGGSAIATAANNLGFFATTTSAQLAGVISDETGSGNLVFATSPTLVTPVLGAATGTSLQLSGLTASSAVATDASKNLISVTNTGSGNNVLATSPTLVTPVLGAATGTSLQLSGLTASSAVATDASKNLVSVTNTGSGNNVLATSPTLVTPTLGAATATSLNGLTVTTSTGALTIANGKTLTASNTITLTGTDGVSANVSNLKTRTIGFSATTPTTGQQGSYVVFPVAGTITGWAIVADTGTATVKVWKIASGTTAPTISNVINTSGVSLSTGTAIISTTVTDFTTTTVSANDIFAFDLTAVSGATKIMFELTIAVT